MREEVKDETKPEQGFKLNRTLIKVGYKVVRSPSESFERSQSLTEVKVRKLDKLPFDRLPGDAAGAVAALPLLPPANSHRPLLGLAARLKLKQPARL